MLVRQSTKPTTDTTTLSALAEPFLSQAEEQAAIIRTEELSRELAGAASTFSFLCTSWAIYRNGNVKTVRWIFEDSRMNLKENAEIVLAVSQWTGCSSFLPECRPSCLRVFLPACPPSACRPSCMPFFPSLSFLWPNTRFLTMLTTHWMLF